MPGLTPNSAASALEHNPKVSPAILAASLGMGLGSSQPHIQKLDHQHQEDITSTQHTNHAAHGTTRSASAVRGQSQLLVADDPLSIFLRERIAALQVRSSCDDQQQQQQQPPPPRSQVAPHSRSRSPPNLHRDHHRHVQVAQVQVAPELASAQQPRRYYTSALQDVDTFSSQCGSSSTCLQPENNVTIVKGAQVPTRALKVSRIETSGGACIVSPGSFRSRLRETREKRYELERTLKELQRQQRREELYPHLHVQEPLAIADASARRSRSSASRTTSPTAASRGGSTRRGSLSKSPMGRRVRSSSRTPPTRRAGTPLSTTATSPRKAATVSYLQPMTTHGRRVESETSDHEPEPLRAEPVFHVSTVPMTSHLHYCTPKTEVWDYNVRQDQAAAARREAQRQRSPNRVVVIRRKKW